MLDPVQRYRRQTQRRFEHDGRYSHIVMAGNHCPDEPGPAWFLASASHLRRLAMPKPPGFYRDDLLLSARVKVAHARKLRLSLGV